VANQDWHGPNRFVGALPTLIALVITASVTGWNDWRVVMVAIPAASILIALVAFVMWVVLPGTREARYWYEFAVVHLWVCLAVGFLALYAWLDGRYEIGLGGLIAISALTMSVGWLIYDRIRAWRRRKHSASGEAFEAEAALGQSEMPATDHLIRITAKGRGEDRRVQAECQECGWREQQTGRGHWPDRRVAELAAKHTSRIVGGVRQRD
jgi:hypothetical protein